MNNYLNVRNGPKMEFVVKEQRTEFEKHVIDIYCEETPSIWGVVTSLETDVLPEINAMYMLVGLSENPSELIKEMNENMIPEFAKYWSKAQLASVAAASPDHEEYAMLGVAQDAFSVLDFHKMSLGVRLGSASVGGTGIHGFMNMPVCDVW